MGGGTHLQRKSGGDLDKMEEFVEGKQRMRKLDRWELRPTLRQRSWTPRASHTLVPVLLCMSAGRELRLLTLPEEL